MLFSGWPGVGLYEVQEVPHSRRGASYLGCPGSCWEVRSRRVCSTACSTLTPLTHVAIAVRLRGAPEQGPDGVGGAVTRSQEGDALSLRQLLGCLVLRGGTVVSEVRDQREVLAWSLLVDAAFVRRPGVVVAEGGETGLGGPGSPDGDTVSGRREGRGSGGGRRGGGWESLGDYLAVEALRQELSLFVLCIS